MGKGLYKYNCSGYDQRRGLPESVPHLTNWLILDNSNIQELCGEYEYLGDGYNITKLSLSSSKLKKICKCGSESTLDALLRSKSLESLDLSGNQINLTKVFNSSVSRINKAKLHLGGNNVKCSCSSLWMANWLNSPTLVQDYTDVKCTSGIRIGTPVYKLKEHAAEMGCVPYNLARNRL